MNLVFRKLEKEDRDYELIWLIIGGLGLFFLYLFLEHIHRNIHCLFKKITGVPCLTCGMVRAFMSLCEPDPVIECSLVSNAASSPYTCKE